MGAAGAAAGYARRSRLNPRGPARARPEEGLRRRMGTTARKFALQEPEHEEEKEVARRRT